MLGPKPGGLGNYARHCGRALETRFPCTVVSSAYAAAPHSHRVASPAGVAIGASRLAAYRRLTYSAFQFPDLPGWVYSPTHHGVFGRRQQVITVHDLICLRYPSQHRFQHFYFRSLLPRLLRVCEAVFTVSRAVKGELIETYHLPEERVFVVPNGVDTDVFRPPAVPAAGPPYLLAVGALYPHKNLHELLSHAELWRHHYRLKLVGAGGDYGRRLRALVAEKGLGAAVDFLDYTPLPELVRLYQHCTALVFPSLAEGFGVPPLEALACGRPAIVSDIAPHRETYRGAVFFITPGQPHTWEHAFEGLRDPHTVSERMTCAADLVARSTWEVAGRALVSALDQVVPGLAVESGRG